MENDTKFEVIIIGGSYAGLSAAMALGRSLRKVLIIDGGLPCNRQTPHSHNLITHDGEKPAVIAAQALEQVLKYETVKIINDFATHGIQTSDGFQIQTQSRAQFYSKKLIFATGVKDLMPEIDGFSDCWGISVIHCPYCHGYEFKNKKTGIMSNGDHAFHITQLVHNLTDDISILPRGKANFDDTELNKLNQHHIKIIETDISKIEHDNGAVKSVVFTNGSSVNFDTVYAHIPFEQHSDIPLSLGCELTEDGHIHVDHFQKTTISGIYACGDNSTPFRSVANSIASGNTAGAMVNMDLSQEAF